MWLLPVWLFVNVGQYALILLLRRYNLAEHERRELALNAIVLTAVTAPVYAAAVVGSVLRRRLAFVVTGKGALSLTDSPAAFRYHLTWLAVIASSLTLANGRGNLRLAFLPWLLVSVAAASAPGGALNGTSPPHPTRPASPDDTFGGG